MNTFNLNHIGLANLQITGFDPVFFSVLGMVIVFCGLVIISLYIFFLPKILNFASRCKKKIKSKQVRDEDIAKKREAARSDEILVAIAAAFHLDQNFPEADQKITWLSHGLDASAWMATGIAHGVSRRHNLHITRRKF